MKLWIDDNREPPDGDWIVVRTYEDAIEALRLGTISSISFDHDLGTEKDGHDVLCWLEEQIENDVLPCPCMVVHSANPVENKNMRQAIERIYEREGITP